MALHDTLFMGALEMDDGGAVLSSKSRRLRCHRCAGGPPKLPLLCFHLLLLLLLLLIFFSPFSSTPLLCETDRQRRRQEQQLQQLAKSWLDIQSDQLEEKEAFVTYLVYWCTGNFDTIGT